MYHSTPRLKEELLGTSALVHFGGLLVHLCGVGKSQSGASGCTECHIRIVAVLMLTSIRCRQELVPSKGVMTVGFARRDYHGCGVMHWSGWDPALHLSLGYALR